MQTDAPIGNRTNAARAAASRNVYSVFGEVVVPIFGGGNAIPGMRSLVLGGSVRCHYSDFGGTPNPKIGLTWKPVRCRNPSGATAPDRQTLAPSSYVSSPT